MNVGELAAREEIRELVARYAHHADGGRMDELAALFAPDGVLRIDDRERLGGREAIRTFLDGSRTRRTDAVAVRSIRHHVTTHAIEVSSPDAATGACYFHVVTDRGLDHWGRYRDRYV